MPEAISDSSTLIHLAGIGRLELLKEFYGKILIAPAVWREVVEEGKGRTGAEGVEEARRLGWIREELDRLRSEGGFWIGDEIYRRALETVAED